jgi:monoamine oxidase
VKGLTRRGVLRRASSGAIAAAWLRGGAARAFATQVDAVVIGAGAAGIEAARTLRGLGVSVSVIEARARIGGRAWTDTSLGPSFDAGAEIIHFADRNPWVDIARGLGREIETGGWRSGGWQVHAQGRPLSAAERARRWQAFRAMEAAQQRVFASGRDQSLAEAVADLEPDLRETARSGLLLVLGEDGERISVLDNMSLWSGPDFTTRDGYGALVAAHGMRVFAGSASGAGLSVALSTPATAIDWAGGGVSVTTPAGTIRARAAIVTVPVGVLRREAIRFSPALPAATLAALDGIGMGALTKIALRFDGERFGLADSTTLMEAGAANRMTMIEMFPGGKPLAVAVTGGDFARGLCEAGEPAAIAAVTDMLAAMLGERVRAHITGGRLAGWWTDPHAFGAYSVCRPGAAPARAALGHPVAERLWFAGEATAGGGAMTVGGATLAGREAALALARSLKG